MARKKSKTLPRPRELYLRVMYEECCAVLRGYDRHSETDATAIAAARVATMALEVDALLSAYKGAARRTAVALADRAMGLGMAYTRMMAAPALERELARASRAELTLDRQPRAIARRAAELRHKTPAIAEIKRVVADASDRYKRTPHGGRRAACLSAARAAGLTSQDSPTTPEAKKGQRAVITRVLRWCERFAPSVFRSTRQKAHART